MSLKSSSLHFALLSAVSQSAAKTPRHPSDKSPAMREKIPARLGVKKKSPLRGESRLWVFLFFCHAYLFANRDFLGYWVFLTALPQPYLGSRVTRVTRGFGAISNWSHYSSWFLNSLPSSCNFNLRFTWYDTALTGTRCMLLSFGYVAWKLKIKTTMRCFWGSWFSDFTIAFGQCYWGNPQGHFVLLNS